MENNKIEGRTCDGGGNAEAEDRVGDHHRRRSGLWEGQEK